MARKRIILDERQRQLLLSLASANCTDDEILAFFEVKENVKMSKSTLDHYFANLLKKGRLAFKAQIKLAQAQLAFGGWITDPESGKRVYRMPNATMLIFLGKNELGQRDVVDIDEKVRFARFEKPSWMFEDFQSIENMENKGRDVGDGDNRETIQTN